MNRINRILVIVDPSAKGRQSAVDKATRLASCLNASVELLICDVASSNDDRVACTLAAPARAAGINVKTTLIHGISLHDSLLDYIRGSNADILIKDTHHHSLARRTLLRNTDWHLSRGCPIPLLLTKGRAWRNTPIVMAAVDPTHVNEKAVRLDRHILYCAASFAGQLAADLHVIHTFVPAAFANAVASGKLSMSREYSEALQVENSYRFGEIERLVAPYGVSREHLHVEMGPPEDCLMDTVKQHQTDVMVMGASSHGRWHRTLVGSTAATLLESLPCDFLIVRPDDAT
jgi:universal stress protein E